MGSNTKGYKPKRFRGPKQGPGDKIVFYYNSTRPLYYENRYPDLSPEELRAKLKQENEEHDRNLHWADGTWVYPEFHVGEPDDTEKIAAKKLQWQNRFK